MKSGTVRELVKVPKSQPGVGTFNANENFSMGAKQI